MATSRTQQNAYKDQWELIIENGNAQARAIADLKKELELLQVEVGSQRGEIHGCSGSVARLDRLITQQTHRMIDESQVNFEQRFQDRVERLEHQLLGMVDAKLKQQQQERWAIPGEEGRCSSDVWAGIKKEQYSHEVYIQDMLRRFGATIKEQDARTISTQEHVERLEKELRAFMKEHDMGVVNGKDELRRFCTAIKGGLDARVACLHERVGDFEKGLDAHVDWVQGELRQLHARSQQDQEQGASFRENAIRVEKELDLHVDWVQGELHRLNALVKATEDYRGDTREYETRFGQELKSQKDWVKTELRELAAAIKAEQDARVAASHEWATRLEEQLDSQAGWVQNELTQIGAGLEEGRGKCPEWTARFEKELDGHASWVKSELRHLSVSVKEGQDHLQGDLRRLDTKLEAEQQALRVERQEEGRRGARLEGLLNEMDCRLLRVQDDLRGHWHKLSVTEHVQCGPAQPPGATLTSRADSRELEQRSPERTWEAFAPAGRCNAQVDDDVVISGSALFGSPARTEMPSVIESADG